MIFVAFEKQQATITEESEGNTPNDTAQEVELPRIGDLSTIIFMPLMNTHYKLTVFMCENYLISGS